LLRSCYVSNCEFRQISDLTVEKNII